MKSKRSNAIVVTGLFFIAATVSAIVGAILYDPLLNNVNYLADGAENANRIVGGALSEIILCCANIGTAIMLYPYLRKFNESIGIGYVCFRFLEVVFIAIGVMSMLSLLTVSKAADSGTLDVTSAAGIGEVLKASYRWTYILGPNLILGINTFLYSYAFYKTRLVPKWLAIFGLTGAILIFITGILIMFGIIHQSSAIHLLIALPIAVFEMVLAGRLLSKGFNQITYD